MRKRLRFAMPRVPLQKLKHIPDTPRDIGEAGLEPVTHVGTMTKRIVEARKAIQGRNKAPQVPLGGDIETSDAETDDSDETHLLGAAAPRNQRDAFQENVAHTQRQLEQDQREDVLRHTKEQLDLDEEEMQQMKRFLLKLRERRKCSGPRVESDSDGEQISGSNFTQGSHNEQAEAIHRHMTVQAIVHGIDLQQSDQKEAMGRADITDNNVGVYTETPDQTIQEDPVEGMQNFDKMKIQPNGEHGGVKPNKTIDRLSREEDKKVMIDQNDVKYQKKKIGRVGKKNIKQDIQQQRHWKVGIDRQPEWGFDESSESDGGWEVEQGDIPLLPR